MDGPDFASASRVCCPLFEPQPATECWYSAALGLKNNRRGGGFPPAIAMMS
jgi:hypothetical protein